ncbi:MAG: Lrp/AsnC family transcriptional regulator [Candidatus ainarchaeum sp.]|nr:Lrp/AsnC family transcriptional regulator [Candidatus ainarchaeum sp.]
MAIEYDEKDVGILRILDENARLSYREIAKRMRMHPNTVIERMKRMEKGGAIERYAPVVNYKKLGYGIIAIIQVDVQGDPHKVMKSVGKHGFVHYAYGTTGEYDGIVVVVCRDVDMLNAITGEIAVIPGVQRLNTKIALEQFGNNGKFEL